jgi:inner membrane transporter RhtA
MMPADCPDPRVCTSGAPCPTGATPSGLFGGRGDREELAGATMIIASASSIQLGAALATTTFDTISPVSAVGIGYTFAALFLLAVSPFRSRCWTRQRLRDAVVLGLVAAVASSSLYLSLDYLPLGSAVTIQFLGPLGLALWTGRQRRSVLLGVALALLGVALVSSATPTGATIGIVIGLVGAGGWAAYLLASPRVGRHGDAGEGLAVAMCVTALACLPFSAAAAPELGSLEILGALAIVGVFARAIPFRLELAALGRLTPASAGVLFSVEPAIAAVVGATVLHQGLAASQLVGILAVVLAGILALRDAPEPC